MSAKSIDLGLTGYDELFMTINFEFWVDLPPHFGDRPQQQADPLGGEKAGLGGPSASASRSRMSCPFPWQTSCSPPSWNLPFRWKISFSTVRGWISFPGEFVLSDTGIGQLALGLAPNHGDPGVLGGDPLVAGPAAHIRPVDDAIAALEVRQGGHIDGGFLLTSATIPMWRWRNSTSMTSCPPMLCAWERSSPAPGPSG